MVMTEHCLIGRLVAAALSPAYRYVFHAHDAALADQGHHLGLAPRALEFTALTNVPLAVL
jgi:hypothetical protein